MILGTLRKEGSLPDLPVGAASHRNGQKCAESDGDSTNRLHLAFPSLSDAQAPQWGTRNNYRGTPRWGTTVCCPYINCPRPLEDNSGLLSIALLRAEDVHVKTSDRQRLALVVFELGIVIPTLLLLLRLLSDDPGAITWDLVGLTLLVAVVELLPVPAWGNLQFSVSVPVLLMIAILYPPAAAGAAAFLGASDLREIRREIPLLVAVFNRSQVALSVMAASFVFHRVAEVGVSPAWMLVLGAALASAADYLVNVGVVTAYMSIKTGASPFRVARELRIGRIGEFLASYLGLAVLGLTLAVLFEEVTWFALPAFLIPMLFARQMFFRSQALEEAHKELQDREQVLRALSNAMAEERADERLQIAGYLHDDLAQVLFRLSIQVDVARKLLDKGDIPEVTNQLDKIRESKQETSDRIRALIRDLHRSPLGAKGLAEALESFTDEVGRDSGVQYHRDVEDIPLPAPIALLVYHIAHEGVMNSLKHARASDMWISVRERGEWIELELKDNGVGFDTSAPGPEGHFGMAMMRERAQVGGGTFDVESQVGEGTTITVRFPTSLLQQEPVESAPEPGGGAAAPAADASPGTPGTTEPVADGSRQTVRA